MSFITKDVTGEDGIVRKVFYSLEPMLDAEGNGVDVQVYNSQYSLEELQTLQARQQAFMDEIAQKLEFFWIANSKA